jgi:hypothetical protein
MWTRICPTSKLVPVAKSFNPPLVVSPHDSGMDASALRHGRSAFQRLAGWGSPYDLILSVTPSLSALANIRGCFRRL